MADHVDPLGELIELATASEHSGENADGATSLDTTGLASRLFAGWGRTSPSTAHMTTPADLDSLARLFGTDRASNSPLSGSPAPENHPAPLHACFIARGLGRSYGDAAQCAGGVVIDMLQLNRIGPIDPATGQVEVEGGASIGALLRQSLPLGWCVAVTPGTEHVTVGGAIAADVHGKNHHRDGSFCQHVTHLTLVTPTGTRVVSPPSEPELFWATAGGMGLTGVVVKATLQLIPVETSWMTVDTLRFDDLDELMATMESSDDSYRYSVAWVDCMPHRNHFGRSVLTRGDHTRTESLQSTHRFTKPRPDPTTRLSVPAFVPRGLINPYSVRLFNEAWFRSSPRREYAAVRRYSSFFHPLDGIANWNLLYGPNGFVQYQFVVSPQNGEAIHRAVAMIAESRLPSFLAVLKRFGPGNSGLLSFPIEGWTLALDFPVGPPELPALLDRLDELVAGVGGRVYLAKDARLRPEYLSVMYPRLGELRIVRKSVDPDGILQSDLSRRLAID
jgi:decaprenylphospho-beta-D-ribofuranose 2-oxidase